MLKITRRRAVISLPCEDERTGKWRPTVCPAQTQGLEQRRHVCNLRMTASWEWLQVLWRTGPEFKVLLTMVEVL